MDEHVLEEGMDVCLGLFHRKIPELKKEKTGGGSKTCLFPFLIVSVSGVNYWDKFTLDTSDLKE